jgi:hypothetical protein
MAKIKFTAFMADARGSVAGTVFSKNRYSAYTRTKVSPVNPQTIAQQGVRQFFTQLSQAWRALTELQRKLWNQNAINFNRTNVFGDQVKLNGFNLFKQLNQNLLVVGQPVINDAPAPGAVFGFTSASLAADTGGGTLILTYAPVIPAGTSVILSATTQLSAGVNFVKSELRKIDTIIAADVSPLDISAEYIVKFGALPAVGTKVFVEIKPVNDTTGQAGTPLKLSAIAI